jgi:hypothetical protein
MTKTGLIRGPTAEGTTDNRRLDAVAPGTDKMLVARVVDELTTTADGPVAYGWVVGHARRRYDMERPVVERSVEALVAEGVLQKPSADRLTVV